MADITDAIIDVVDERIAESFEVTKAVGTIASLTPLTVIFDGAATATPVISHGDVALVDGTRVTLQQFGSDWTITGTFAPGPYTKTFAGLTAASASVTGASTLAGGGTLTGTFAGTKTFSGTNTISGTLTSSGGTLSGTWAGSPTLTGTLSSSGGSLTGSWAGSHTFSGQTTYSGTLTSSGGTLSGTWLGSPTFSGTPEFSGDITMTGIPVISGSFTVNDTLTGSTAILAGTWAGNPTFSGEPDYGLGTAATDIDQATTLGTTSTSYTDVTGLSITYTKQRANSVIVVIVAATFYSTVTNDIISLGVNDGTNDHDVGGAILNPSLLHVLTAGSCAISGMSVGAKTFTARVKRTTGTGTISRNGNDFGSITAFEVG